MRARHNYERGTVETCASARARGWSAVAAAYVCALVEGDSHDAVGGVESLLDAVAVVDVDVQVQHPRVVLEQLQDAEHLRDQMRVQNRVGAARCARA
eukprot:5434224-Prymnesium_polylepis.1